MFTLFLVPTPLGNLEDITLRALRVLKESSLILAEDTRHSQVLMQHFEIKTQMSAYHDHNKERVEARFIQHLRETGDIALISDAGTPGIADPAFNLVRACVREGIPVVSLPGPCALTTALVGSGLPTDRFRFEYFAPKKSAQRTRLFEELKEGEATIVMYASPYQIVNVLEELETVYGSDLRVVLARELTKKFEEFLRGTVAELRLHYKERVPKGEFVVLWHPQNKG
jgi:16S rRNA (cytidine1402-2'-O)-methyltransferase